MANFIVKYVQCADAASAYQVVGKNLEASKDKIFVHLPQPAQISYDLEKKQILLQGSGVKLLASFVPGQVEGHLELPLLLRPFSRKILQVIEEEISKVV